MSTNLKRRNPNLKSRKYYRTRSGKILEMHLGLGYTPQQISKILDITQISVSDTLNYFYKKPKNPVTITLQSKINKPEE